MTRITAPSGSIDGDLVIWRWASSTGTGRIDLRAGVRLTDRGKGGTAWMNTRKAVADATSARQTLIVLAIADGRHARRR